MSKTARKAEVVSISSSASKKRFDAISEKLIECDGNGALLSQNDRNFYIKEYCKHLGLNLAGEPLRWDTRFNKKTGITIMKICAKASASKQLIQRDNISIERTDRWEDDENWYVEVKATKGDQSVINIGYESKSGLNNKGNALNSAYTKAIKRAVLSISGAGMLDESEVATIPDSESYIETQNESRNTSQNRTQKSPRKRVDDLMDIDDSNDSANDVNVDDILNEMSSVVDGIDGDIGGESGDDYEYENDYEEDNDFSDFSIDVEEDDF